MSVCYPSGVEGFGIDNFDTANTHTTYKDAGGSVKLDSSGREEDSDSYDELVESYRTLDILEQPGGVCEKVTSHLGCVQK